VALGTKFFDSSSNRGHVLRGVIEGMQNEDESLLVAIRMRDWNWLDHIGSSYIGPFE
jgi:hypothetical protein